MSCGPDTLFRFSFRLVDETVAAFDAQTGVVHLAEAGQLQPIHTASAWSGTAD